MNTLHKLLLLAGITAAALALTTPTATAQETEIEVIMEANGDPCDPCIVRFHGESIIRLIPAGGAIIITCQDEYEGSINHNGSGEIYFWHGVAHAGSNCSVTPCAPDERDWDITNLGELGDGLEHMTVRFCLFSVPLNTEVHCDGEVLMADGTGNHDYLFEMHQRCAGGALEVEGSWETERDENHNNIELVHHDA